MLSIGDYIAAAGHRDVTGVFRGTYDDEAGAHDHILDNDGCEGLIDLTGVSRTDEPQRGDVTLIHGIGALFTGHSYVLRLERGVVEINARLYKPEIFWRV
jgi:hypothetical protein